MISDRLRLGDYDIYGLRDGFFYLDGGAMFGVVPKTLWEKKCPADAQNRIRLALNSLLIKTPAALVLVETGIGSKLDRKFQDIYCVEQNPGLLGSLARLGFAPEEIDFVINTHLHFDHCGGNTIRDEKGAVVPAFPRARYIIQKGEWEWAMNPHEREKGSYQAENFRPLADFGLLRLVDGDAPVTEGVEVILAPGHTARHQCVKVVSGGKTLVYLGDLVPTSAHIGLAYGMSYDLHPLENLENKRKLYSQAVAEDWILAFVHDPVRYFGRVGKVNQKFEFRPLD
ncbi:MAG TPA: MBL fold metallo-hydrolase [Candidatus Aminicenantes bacterium]|nr:MBL fold metallo-hydrolase [Candidatus Aminicenantes bacterium]